MADVCPLLLLTSDFAETTSVSIGCYGYRPYIFGCIFGHFSHICIYLEFLETFFDRRSDKVDYGTSD